MALLPQQKLHRVLTFLTAARLPRIFSRLATRGFTSDELEEGWELFMTAAGAKLAFVALPSPPPDSAKRLLADLDDWENTWYPVVSATLKRHFPVLHAQVFQNLAQTSGDAVMLSVPAMLDRLEEMRNSTDGQKADALLVSRGLTPAVRKVARDLLTTLESRAEGPVPEIDTERLFEQEKALEEVWGWYREWAEIARAVIQRGDLLIRLGLREPSPRERDFDEEDLAGG